MSNTAQIDRATVFGSDDQKTQEKIDAISRLFLCTREAILITDVEGRILETNSILCEESGFPRNELLGRTPRIFRSGRHGPEFYSEMWKSLRSTGGWKGMVCNRKKNGEEYNVTLSIFAVKESNQNGNEFYVGLSSRLAATATNDDGETRSYIDFRFVEKRVLGAMFRAKTRRKMLYVCHVDINSFGRINQQLGRKMGDRVLDIVTSRLNENLESPSSVVRHDSDEFLMLIEGGSSAAECESQIRASLSRISEPMVVGDDGEVINLTASIGVSIYPDHLVDDPSVLLLQAQRASAIAKSEGCDNFRIFDAADKRYFQWRGEVFKAFQKALTHGDLCLYYQPKIDIQTNQIIGLEALIRWLKPVPVAPADFLPVINGTPLEMSLGRWVLREAFRQMSVWHEAGVRIPVSINISPGHLASGQLFEDIKRALEDFPDVSPEDIEIEMLENSTFDNIEVVAKLIEECRSLGVLFSIDDFGSGYSSLIYLKYLPVSTIKIDKAFVLDIVHSCKDLAIVKSIIELGQLFDRKVIAEGVETEAHLQALARLGCYGAQGFGIAYPMEATSVPDWISRWDAGTAV